MTPKPDADAVLRRAATTFGIPASDICGPRRFRRLMPARQAVAWALQRLGFSFIEIGEVLGDRDHATAIHAVQKADERAAEDAEYAAQLHALITEPPVRRTRARRAITWQTYWTAESIVGTRVLAA